MKIGFYVNNDNIKDVDLTQISTGNPGIGGTQYVILNIALSLSEKVLSSEIILFANHIDYLPKELKKVKVQGLADAIKKAKDDDLDYLIFKPESIEIIDTIILESKQKCITWAHNFYDSKTADIINNNEYIVKNVFVGKNQYFRYIDHDIIKKSIYIYNPIIISHDNNDFNRFNEINITYLGSLVESKGFHVLAKQWGKITKRFPNAVLNVIGSGQVHSRNVKLGKFQIAEETYEKRLLKYISREGKILSSIKFHGILGSEKNAIIAKTTVGIVNPTGRTETFGLSVSEFNVQNVPVVSKRTNGLIDTLVNNKNGLSYVFERNLHKKVIKLIINEKNNIKLGVQGYKFVVDNFQLEKIVNKWVILISSLNSDNLGLDKVKLTRQYLLVNNNFLRYLNSKIRGLSLFRNLPALIFYENITRDVIKRFKK